MTDWEKICANHIFDKRLIFRICKELSKFNNMKTSKPITIWAKDLNRHFTKDKSTGNDVQSAINEK